MENETPGKRQTTKFSRSARTQRILERLREGRGFDDIAYEEGLTERRVRQIVTEFVEEREALEGSTHARMQIDRLGRAMQVAAAALARGDIRAIGPFIKVIDRLDRHQALAQESERRRTTSSDEAIAKSLVEQLKAIAWEAVEAGTPSDPEGTVPPPVVAEAETRPSPAPPGSTAPAGPLSLELSSAPDFPSDSPATL